ncbi:MAG: hypothetical protein WC796_06095 [Candidatus Pacearchaeota archaeon]
MNQQTDIRELKSEEEVNAYRLKQLSFAKDKTYGVATMIKLLTNFRKSKSRLEELTKEDGDEDGR